MPFCTSMAQRTASYHAAELDDAPVAGALHYATVMDTDGRGDQIAPERPQPCQRALLIAAREAAEADHVSGKDGSKLSFAFRSSRKETSLLLCGGKLIVPHEGSQSRQGPFGHSRMCCHLTWATLVSPSAT